MKPKITNQFDHQITFRKGKDSSIPCYAEGIPEPRISWKKGDKDIIYKNYSGIYILNYGNVLTMELFCVIKHFFHRFLSCCS